MKNLLYSSLKVDQEKLNGMLKIIADHRLPELEIFRTHFDVSTYHDETSLRENLHTHDILICRSTLTVNDELLRNTKIQMVATASSGMDHLHPLKHAIPYLNAPGCNANAVTDYVTSTLAWLIDNQQCPIPKVIGIIGMGPVGQSVYHRLLSLGFKCVFYDPWQFDPLQHPLHNIQQADVICLHANLHDRMPYPTRHMINSSFLSQLKPGTVIINAARGELVDTAALYQKHDLIYSTDVYAHEPYLEPEILQYATLCTPHIAGHSIEAKKNAVHILAEKIHAYAKKPYVPYRYPPHLIQPTSHWIDTFLNYYNPIDETRSLQQSTHIETTFLTLRSLHHGRHDLQLPNDTKRLLTW